MTEAADPVTSPPVGAHRRGARYIRPLISALFTAMAVTGTNHLVERLQSRALQQTLTRQMTPVGHAFAAAIQERVSLLDGVVAWLTVSDGATEVQEFPRLAERLLRDHPGVYLTALTHPDGRTMAVWPSRAIPPTIDSLFRGRLRGRDHQRALESPGQILSDPIESGAWGRVLTTRVAVRDATDSVRAVALLVMAIDSIFSEAGLDNLPDLQVTVVDEGLQFVAGVRHPVADRPPTPIMIPIRIGNRDWAVDIVPTVGWQRMVRDSSRIARIAIGVAGVFLFGIAWIFTDRERTQAELARQLIRQRAEQKFVRLFAMTPDGVVLTRESDGTILEVNPGFVAISQRNREALLGRRGLDLGLWPSEVDRQAFRDELRARESVIDYPLQLARPDGELRETRISARRFDLDGESCILSIVRDVHEQRRLERRLADAQRLEAVGRLAGGVAHDFNNLITGIAGFTAMLTQHLGGDPVAQGDLREISRAADRATNLTRQLLGFARRQVVAPRIVELNTIVQESHGILRSVVGPQVTVTLIPSTTPAPVRIDPIQVDQLLNNLAANARDAMPTGGDLRIEVHPHGTDIQLRVTDTGEGIADEVLPHLFEPFYTTKQAGGKGTGLGLATCYGIMQQAGGRIEVQSVPGQGTTFVLIFPREAEPLTATTAVPAAGAAPGGGETILLVEDEHQIRTLCTRLLRTMGHQVLSAENGAEAMSVAAAHEGRIDLLLTDMVMPVMGGAELIQAIRVARPEIRVLIMSGYSDDLLDSRPANAPFLGKPFTPADLATAIRSTLAR